MTRERGREQRGTKGNKGEQRGTEGDRLGRYGLRNGCGKNNGAKGDRESWL